MSTEIYLHKRASRLKKVIASRLKKVIVYYDNLLFNEKVNCIVFIVIKCAL